jgi:hypothetical protein
MIFSTLLFFPASFHQQWTSRLRHLVNWQPVRFEKSVPSKKHLAALLLSVYVTLQVCIPLRYLLYPGDLFWTEEGFRFSWRVMLMDKDGHATFYVVDPKTRGSIEINNEMYLTPVQIKEMSTQPDMILQFAQHLGEQFRDTVLVFGKQRIHLQQPSVEADVYVTINGRPHQLYVDRSTNLMQQEYSLKHRTWLKSYRE